MALLTQTRRLTAEEIAARLPRLLHEQEQKNRQMAKERAEQKAKADAYNKANEIRREAHEYLARQNTPSVGPSLADKLLSASRKGMRIQGPQGKFLSVKKAAGF